MMQGAALLPLRFSNQPLSQSFLSDLNGTKFSKSTWMGAQCFSSTLTLGAPGVSPGYHFAIWLGEGDRSQPRGTGHLGKG